MEVAFTNIPIAFNFMFKSGNGGGFVSQSVNSEFFEPINTMAYEKHTVDGVEVFPRTDKSFVMNIADWQTSDPLATDSSITGPITLKPGQSLICSPYIDPDASFKRDTSGGILLTRLIGETL